MYEAGVRRKSLCAPHLRSTVPTAFAGYSFHAAEAALVFANEIIVVFLFPIHAGLHRAYHLFTTLIHLGAFASHSSQQCLMRICRPVSCSCPTRRYAATRIHPARCCTGGHAGYEIAPLVPSLEALLWAAVSAGGSAPALNTVKHHDMCASRRLVLKPLPSASCPQHDGATWHCLCIGCLPRLPAADAGTTASRHGTLPSTSPTSIDGAPHPACMSTFIRDTCLHRRDHTPPILASCRPVPHRCGTQHPLYVHADLRDYRGRASKSGSS